MYYCFETVKNEWEEYGMVQIIIGNIVAFIASLIMVYSGYLKQKKKILYVQTVQIGLLALSNIILGGITGAIINKINCVRNVLCYNGKLNNTAIVLLIVVSIILSLGFNNLGIIGLLPLISSTVYILFMNTQDVIKFKYVLIFTVLLWFFYDFYIKSYTAACFDILTIITSIISIIQIKKKLKQLQ